MGKGGTLLPMIGERPKPKSLIEALSDIQMYANAERDGFAMPESYLLMRERLAFLEVGLKGGLVSMGISGLLQPLNLAVVDRLFPIFGTLEPSAFDQAFALLLGVSFSLAYAVMIAVNVSACYIGAWCRAAIRALFGGLILGKVIALAGLFWLYHALYLAMTPERIAWLMHQTEFLQRLLLISPVGSSRLHHWLLDIRPLFLISAWLLVAFTVLIGAVAGAVFYVGLRRQRRELAGWEG